MTQNPSLQTTLQDRSATGRLWWNQMSVVSLVGWGLIMVFLQ